MLSCLNFSSNSCGTRKRSHWKEKFSAVNWKTEQCWLEAGGRKSLWQILGTIDNCQTEKISGWVKKFCFCSTEATISRLVYVISGLMCTDLRQLYLIQISVILIAPAKRSQHFNAAYRIIVGQKCPTCCTHVEEGLPKVCCNMLCPIKVAIRYVQMLRSYGRRSTFNIQKSSPVFCGSKWTFSTWFVRADKYPQTETIW